MKIITYSHGDAVHEKLRGMLLHHYILDTSCKSALRWKMRVMVLGMVTP